MGSNNNPTGNKFILMLFLMLTILAGFILLPKENDSVSDIKLNITWWNIQSIDTVKYSRDIAREKLNDQDFDKDIDTQVRLIAETGATHVAVGTPYDSEFIPFLKRWVDAARKYGLNVWFRGNFSGWEGWFGYPKITRAEHLQKIQDFISENSEIFADGDIFTTCPECENGGPGDPRKTKDVAGHREFLIQEFKIADRSFNKIGKNVRSNFMSMNGDVALLVMDRSTTKALGNIVVIDHYVNTPEKLLNDIKNLARGSGGNIVLGEFGAPIPDIHGKLNEEEQAKWINDALSKVSQAPELVGINYWTGFGGSTELWDDNYDPRKAVGVIKTFFKPETISGSVKDEFGLPIRNAIVTIGIRTVATDNNGKFTLPVVSSINTITVNAAGYTTRQILDENKNITTINMVKERKSLLYKIQKFIRSKLKIQ